MNMTKFFPLVLKEPLEVIPEILHLINKVPEGFDFHSLKRGLQMVLVQS